MLTYRELNIDEAKRIAGIDTTNYIKNAWRINANSGEYNRFLHRAGVRATAEVDQALFEADLRDIYKPPSWVLGINTVSFLEIQCLRYWLGVMPVFFLNWADKYSP